MHGIQVDSWCGSVRPANEAGIHWHLGVFLVKQYSSLFPIELNEKVFKGGAHCAKRSIKGYS